MVGTPRKQPERARFTVADHRALAWWAADCAEHVLEIFERAHPDDVRPREAIEATRAWVRGEISMMQARCFAFAAHAAARDADGAARAAARAAGQAFGTCHIPRHAAAAAAYARAAADSDGERAWQQACWPDFDDEAQAREAASTSWQASATPHSRR